MKMKTARGFLSLLVFAIATPAVANNFNNGGIVGLTNLQGALSFDGSSTAVYAGQGFSRQIGWNIQSGSILPDPTTVDPSRLETEGILTFRGVQGPNPFFGGRPIHVIYTRRGLVFCTWTAVFTGQFSPDGMAVLRGDGRFRVVGGTGRYRNARGTFRTLFETIPIPATSDSAIAWFTQQGRLGR